MCVNEQINGVTRDGGYGQYVTLRTEAVVSIPTDVDPVEASPLLCAGVTVFNSLRQQKIFPGETVAVQGEPDPIPRANMACWGHSSHPGTLANSLQQGSVVWGISLFSLPQNPVIELSRFPPPTPRKTLLPNSALTTTLTAPKAMSASNSKTWVEQLVSFLQHLTESSSRNSSVDLVHSASSLYWRPRMDLWKSIPTP